KVHDDNDTVQVELAENVRVRVVRSTLTSVMSKGAPAPAAEKKDDKKGDDDGDGDGKSEGGGRKSLFSFGGKK
ncbi:MAG: hypothetical protein QF491_09100, partial [Alphaproteobacteria bacterium]|nr:hypothetical protein [Alphaproteobacteria bacterium]